MSGTPRRTTPEQKPPVAPEVPPLQPGQPIPTNYRRTMVETPGTPQPQPPAPPNAPPPGTAESPTRTTVFESVAGISQSPAPPAPPANLEGGPAPLPPHLARGTMLEMPGPVTASPPAAAPPAPGEAPTTGRQTVAEPAPDVGTPHATPALAMAGIQAVSSGVLDPGEIPIFRPSVRPPMALLVLLDDGSISDGESFRVRSDRVVIGRAAEADIRIPHDEAISSRHAEVVRERAPSGYTWALRDLGSTNGTFIRCASVVTRRDRPKEIILGMHRYTITEQNGKLGLLRLSDESDAWFELPILPAAIGSDPSQSTVLIRDDPYIDPVHCLVENSGPDQWTVHDNRSTNSLWVRTRGRTLDTRRLLFMLGEQRFVLKLLP